jgi:hypothetical protein
MDKQISRNEDEHLINLYVMMTSNLYTVRGKKNTHAHVLIFKDVNGQSVINSVINPLSAKTLIIKYIILKKSNRICTWKYS